MHQLLDGYFINNDFTITGGFCLINAHLSD